MQYPNSFENDNNVVTTAKISFFDGPPYESETAPARTFQQTPRMISQPNNIFLTCEKISNSIKAIKKNARKQLEEANELKDQLAQLKQYLNTQRQQPPMPRRINRNRVRSHPYLNEHPLVSSHTSTIPVTPTDRDNNEENSFHSQHAANPAAATDFPESFPTSSQNFEYFNGDNNA